MVTFLICLKSRVIKNALFCEDIYMPVSIPLVASTGHVLVRCWQHRPSTRPVVAHNGMFMGKAFKMSSAYDWI